MQINTNSPLLGLGSLHTQNQSLPSKNTDNNSNSSTIGSSSVVSISNEAKSAYVQSQAAKELEDFMNMSEGERLQWIWLNSHGVTPEEFANMSDADKQKLLDQMREELKLSMQKSTTDV